MSESLLRTWRNKGEAPGMHLVDSDHPLQFFVGRDDSGRARIVIRGPVRPRVPNLSGLVQVERFQDQSGRWNLRLVLHDPAFEEVFLRLADDMHDRTADAVNETVATDRVFTIIDQWRRLLRSRPSGVLTMEELRGLVGELWLVLHWFSADRGVDVALEGWLGPLGLPQDFWFAQDGYYEAKCIGPSTARIRISSAEQLDQPDIQLLVLIVAGTDEAAEAAINLPTVVTRLQAALAAVAASDQPLRERLEHMGVELDESFYQDTWFVVTAVDTYAVNEDFPAIRASALAAGIDRVRYQIDLEAIAEFRTSTRQIG